MLRYPVLPFSSRDVWQWGGELCNQNSRKLMWRVSWNKAEHTRSYPDGSPSPMDVRVHQLAHGCTNEKPSNAPACVMDSNGKGRTVRDAIKTKLTASTLSPLTWKIGASMDLAMADGYGIERAKRGSVVKPIWLLTMRCIVLPVP